MQDYPGTGKGNRRHRILAILIAVQVLCLIWPLGSRGQPSFPDSCWVNVAAIRFDQAMFGKCLFASTARDSADPRQLAQLPYRNIRAGEIYPNAAAPLMTRTTVFEIGLFNDSKDTESLYFTPGYYFRNLRVYKGPATDSDSSWIRLPDSNANNTYSGAFGIQQLPGTRSRYYFAFDLIRTNTNNVYPYLIEMQSIGVWRASRKRVDSTLNTITYVISGILLMMIFYSLAVYLQNRSKEFIYYSVYAFCSAILVFYKSFLIGENTPVNFFYEEYLDFMILGLGVYFYLIFMRKFLNTSQEHPFLDRFLKLADWILVALLGIFSGIYFFTRQYVALNFTENYVTKIFLFCIGIVFIIYSLRRKNTLLNYLAAGNLALILFSILSLCMVLGVRFFPSQPGIIWNKGMFYYELGLVFELLFFLSGLAYKNRHDLIERVKERERLKLENERKEFEKQVAVLSAKTEERDRISTDMHDELGSGMTAIRLMSEIVKAKMKNEYYPELERISNSANDLLGKMNTIIWTMKSSNDSLESLVAYLREHSLQYFENTAVNCRVEVPDEIPFVEMSGEKRRNIFLSVKESLNNVLKHAQASQVFISIAILDSRLLIRVKDDGVGIDTEKLRRFGNGLSNMKRRMESIGGEFSVESDAGSTILFSSPL